LLSQQSISSGSRNVLKSGVRSSLRIRAEVLKEPARLADFNTQLPKSFSKPEIKSVLIRDHFTELRESHVLQVCASANIISKSLHNILTEKLKRRNTAAHPSGTVTPQPTAEEFIGDLVENVGLPQ